MHNLLGPAGTSQEYIDASANIGAHELGHSMGLRHRDSFGPIGQGVPSAGLANGLLPTYPGPVNATESQFHIMATPAFGLPAANFITGDQFFSIRSAIKLSTFTQNGQVLAEQGGVHGTTATAQPILLDDLFVPNTTLSGPFVGDELEVDATTVTGSLTSAGEMDFYSFSANAGDILNLEVISSVLNGTNPVRITNPFDTMVRVLDSSGTVLPLGTGIADNDDEIESTDSVIIDLPIPTTGTLFNPARCAASHLLSPAIISNFPC